MTYARMTDAEIAQAVRGIANSARSKEDVHQRVRALGYDGSLSVAFHSAGGMSMCMIMMWGHNGCISV